MRHHAVWLGLILFGALSLWWAGSRPDRSYTRIDGAAFATSYQITYAGGEDRNNVQRAVDEQLSRIDAMASTWRSDSELMRYNRVEHPPEFELSDELAGLIEQGMQIEAQTDGAFSLRPNGRMIDLSGITKGYAVDRIVELLRNKFKITDCLVDIGGEVRAIGPGPHKDGWRIGLYVPMEAAGIDAPVLRLRNNSVATSGAYFKGDHIIDPSTGRPVDHDLISASVVHPSNTKADALATAMFVMGPERGLMWARANNIHVILLHKNNQRSEHIPGTPRDK